MIFLLAWRNVWRSKRRSLVLLAAITLGLWGGIIAIGIMHGFAETYVNAAIDRDLSHLQIHTPAYLSDALLVDHIPGADAVAAQLRGLSDVEEVSPRMLVQAMASSAVTAQMVSLIGVDPAAEQRVTTPLRHLEAGTILDSSGRMTAVVGATLARKLALRLRSKIVLSFQGTDGSIVYGGFRVGGIYRTESSVFDGGTVFVRREDLGGLVGSGPIAHEIAIRLTTGAAVERTVDTIRALHPGLDVKGWKELAPELRITTESTGLSMTIFLGVILFALLFGITNTMLMSVLDRVREFGILMALGMRRRRLFGLLLMETVLLAVTGAAGGMVLGGGTVWYLGREGVDLSWFSEGLAFFGLPVMLYPVLPETAFQRVILMVIVTALIAAVYPAVKAVRLKPATAIRSYG